MTLATLLKQQAQMLRERNAAAVVPVLMSVTMGEWLASDLNGDMGSPFGMGPSHLAAIEDLETKYQERQ